MDLYVGSDELNSLHTTLVAQLDNWISASLIVQLRAVKWQVTEIEYPNDGTVVGVYRIIPQSFSQSTLPTLGKALEAIRIDIFNRGYSNNRLYIQAEGWIRETWHAGESCYVLVVYF